MAKKYQNPPINELVIGVYFNPPLFNFRAEHVGLFWSQVKADYPKIQQQPPLRAFDFTGPDEVFPMPRFWLLSKEGDMLMQVQKSGFFFNWRRQRNGEYPHFEAVKAEFDRFYDKLLAFLAKEAGAASVVIESCELAYVNLIEEGDYWRNSLDTAAVLPSFGMLDVGISGRIPPDFNALTAFHPENDLSLSVTLQTRRNAESNKNVLYFEIKATGSLGKATKSEADIWFTRGHDHIIACFEKVTSPEIQDRFWVPAK